MFRTVKLLVFMVLVTLLLLLLVVVGKEGRRRVGIAADLAL